MAETPRKGFSADFPEVPEPVANSPRRQTTRSKPDAIVKYDGGVP